MSVYVDNMQAPYCGMLMCHMFADTSDELTTMVSVIGVDNKWIQSQGTYAEHFDVCQSKRRLAVQAGAVEVEYRQFGAMLRHRQVNGVLGNPQDVIDWLKTYHKSRRHGIR